MAIINRAALKAQFRSGTMPKATDYDNLIDSMLVRRNDNFFGRWEKNTQYCLNDVVIYKNALYCCIAQNDDPCGCDENGNAKQDPAKPKGSICSDTPPDEDKTNWQLLELERADEDWTIIRENEDDEGIMYANIFGKIGMGTKEPTARVHIHVEETGANYLFSPDNINVPQFDIRKIGDNAASLSVSIEENKAKFSGMSDGFLFQPAGNPTIPPGEQAQQQQQSQQTESCPPVFITSYQNKPAVGIGTLKPAAALALQEQQGKSILLNPWNRVVPEILMNHRAAGTMSCLSISVNENYALFTANNVQDFQFRKGMGDCETYIQDGTDNSKVLVTIKEQGNVGIGIENPQALLDVGDHTGNFQMSITETNPALAIVNTRPGGTQRNYFTLGADNDSSVLITDSAKGFIFRKGKEFDKNKKNHQTINQPTFDLLSINPKGIVNVGDEGKLKKCKFNVFGISQMYNLFIDTSIETVYPEDELEPVLEKIMDLKPKKFHWREDYTNDDTEQYGLISHEVQDIFKEAVVKETAQGKVIAYPNLVAVLVKGIQEQQRKIEELENRIAKLEKKSAS